jgi:hypothetical protein
MQNEQLRSLVKTLYKTRDGEPLLLSDGQLEIYEAIVTRSHPFWHVMTHTQYGKSENQVEEIKIQDKWNNEFAILLNGVLMTPIGMPLPWGECACGEIFHTLSSIPKSASDALRQMEMEYQTHWKTRNGPPAL